MPCVGVRLPGCVPCQAVPRAADLAHTGVSGWSPGGLRGGSVVFAGAACPSDDVGTLLFLVDGGAWCGWTSPEGSARFWLPTAGLGVGAGPLPCADVLSFLRTAASALISIPTFSPSDDPPLDATSVGRDRGMLVSFRPFGNFAGFVMVSVVE